MSAFEGRILEFKMEPKPGMSPELDMTSEHGIVTVIFTGKNWDITVRRETPKKTRLMKLTELLGYDTAITVLKVIDDHDQEKT